MAGAPPRGGQEQQQQQQQQSAPRSKWWSILCAVAYELRPFTPPTRDDVRRFYISTSHTLRILGQEGAALARTVGHAASTHLTWRRVLPVAVYVGLQWAAARVEFGLVFFILAMLGLILTVGLGDDASRQGPGGERLSPWSVFNQGMRSILGTLDPAQFEAEIRNYGLEDGGLGEQLLLRRGGQGGGEAAAGGGYGDNDGAGQQQQGGQGGAAAGGPARKSGKKARRNYEERRRRRRGLGGADAGGGGGGGVGEDGWEEDWVSDGEG